MVLYIYRDAIWHKDDPASVFASNDQIFLECQCSW